MNASLISQSIKTVQYTASGANVARGEVVLMTDCVGVARLPINDGETGTLDIIGKFSVTKLAGEAWTQGQVIYWDLDNDRATTSAVEFGSVLPNCVVLGVAAAAAASAATTGEVLLNVGSQISFYGVNGKLSGNRYVDMGDKWIRYDGDNNLGVDIDPTGETITLTVVNSVWSLTTSAITMTSGSIQLEDATSTNFVIVSATGTQIIGAVGFYGATPIAKPTVSGSTGANAALQSLLTALEDLGLITDSTT